MQDYITLTAEQSQHATRDKDFTVYWEIEDLNRSPVGLTTTIIEKLNLSQRDPTTLTSPNWRFEDTVEFQTTPPQKEPVTARASIVRCFRGKYLSATFRIKGDPPSAPPIACDARPSPPPLAFDKWSLPCIDNALVQNQLHARLLHQYFGGNDRILNGGAVVLAGGTGSGKSEIASAFALHQINILVTASTSETAARERYPHLVTFEDPIEGWCLRASKAPLARRSECDVDNPTASTDSLSIPLQTPELALRHGFCLTPRQQYADVTSLSEALIDAKRQTPKCFYVGEVRNPKDWIPLLDFAGSGHLVVATTHAASVREAMSRMLAGCKSTTAEHRREWGSRILGIVHLRPGKVSSGGCKPKKVIFPSVWRQCGASLSSLVSSGLSSLVPNDEFLLGRQRYFETMREGGHHGNDAIPFAEIESIAAQLDVEELRQQ